MPPASPANGPQPRLRPEVDPKRLQEMGSSGELHGGGRQKTGGGVEEHDRPVNVFHDISHQLRFESSEHFAWVVMGRLCRKKRHRADCKPC